MTDKKRKVLTVASICAGLALISAISVNSILMYSNAKYTDAVDESYTANLQDFNVDFSLTYNDTDGNEKTVSSGDLASSHGVVRLKAEDYNSLKFNTTYSGQGRCYYRFKITESWQHKEGEVDVITPKQLSKYTLADNLYDNRSDDGYIYCKDILEGDSANYVAIRKFDAGADAGNLIDNEAHKSQFVDISVVVEAVQWNQAEDLWNLEKFPWT